MNVSSTIHSLTAEYILTCTSNRHTYARSSSIRSNCSGTKQKRLFLHPVYTPRVLSKSLACQPVSRYRVWNSLSRLSTLWFVWILQHISYCSNLNRFPDRSFHNMHVYMWHSNWKINEAISPSLNRQADRQSKWCCLMDTAPISLPWNWKYIN